ncbi:MAG: HAE1 family hydrophobic/amphiphilic exporter-1 [Rickettsiales bacterium]
MKKRDITYSKIRKSIESSGENVPIGKNDAADREIIFSSNSEFNDLDKIKNTLVDFYSNEIPTKINNLGAVVDGLEDETTIAFINGKKALFLDIYRQSGSNIIAVAMDVKEQITKMENDFAIMDSKPKIQIVKDGSYYIEKNVFDVYETIIVAVILTIIVVFFFLANGRATLITSISLPIAMISSFILMYLANFSINVVSLLAMSIAVGLLVDDAIVVVENIYRKIESGLSAKDAAIEGTNEILMAVVAITLVVVSVFTPISFMSGIVGQYLKEFGLTIAFSIMVSLFVAITIIPVLCAYLANKTKGRKAPKVNGGVGKKDLKKNKILEKFNDFQDWMETKYEKILIFSINNPLKIIIATLLIFALSIFTFKYVPKNFIDASDNGEIVVSVNLDPDSNIERTNGALQGMDKILRNNKDVVLTAISVGTKSGKSNRGGIYVKLKQDRSMTTELFKQKTRDQIKDFSYANPIVTDYNPSGGGSRAQPFSISLVSSNPEILNKYVDNLVKKLKSDPRLKDVDTSNEATRDELKIVLKENSANLYGVNDKMMGDELRGYIEGYVVGKLRQDGYEYDIRLRLKKDQRDLKSNFDNFYIANINNKLIKLSDIAFLQETKEAAQIDRENRGRFIQINASLAPKVGLGDVIKDIEEMFRSDSELKLPSQVRYSFAGDSENLQEMLSSMGFALFLSVLFIYLILASLYESFVTPFTILLALPFALCGVGFGLFLTGESINIFTILGIFLLIAVACKNSILLIDFTNQMMNQGKSRSDALVEAGKIRLRPILMTSVSLIAGTLPVAIGLSEVAKPRTGMGVAIISGLISSTILTLIVVPAVFSYIDRFRVWSKKKISTAIYK